MDYQKRLEQLRAEIEECNSVMTQDSLKVDDSSDSKVDTTKKSKKSPPKRKTKDRTFDLDKFVRKMDRVDKLRKEKDEMRQIMQHGRVVDERTVTNMDSFMDELNKKKFCVPWNRLDTWQKRNRMKKYVTGLEITDDEKQELIKNYSAEIVGNNLGKRVKYDKKEGCIVNIKRD